jgi:hypothetical protein
MQGRLLLLGLAIAALSGRTVAQQIVIEPTNGHTQSSTTTTHVTRPAAEAATLTQKAEKPAHPQSATQKPVAKHHQEVAAKVKTPPSVTEVAKNEPREATLKAAPDPAPEPKKFPDRPAWAMNDARDAHSIQDEITRAFERDAKLRGSAITVKVDEDAVTLEGRAPSSDERLQAERLAQSYAWNRKLVDHVEVVPRVSAQK